MLTHPGLDLSGLDPLESLTKRMQKQSETADNIYNVSLERHQSSLSLFHLQ